MNFNTKVWQATKKIPCGKVASYATVAYWIGKPGAARAVGNALNKNRDQTVPCHRVIRSDGSVGGFVSGTEKKISKLINEKIKIENNKVDSKYILSL